MEEKGLFLIKCANCYTKEDFRRALKEFSGIEVFEVD